MAVKASLILYKSEIFTKQHGCGPETSPCSQVTKQHSFKKKLSKDTFTTFTTNLFLSFSLFCTAKTTNPTSWTGTCRRSQQAPCWCSHVITQAMLSGWATRRRPRCGTMITSPQTGGAHTRVWRAELHRLAFRTPPTGTSCEMQRGVRERQRERERLGLPGRMCSVRGGNRTAPNGEHSWTWTPGDWRVWHTGDL